MSEETDELVPSPRRILRGVIQKNGEARPPAAETEEQSPAETPRRRGRPPKPKSETTEPKIQKRRGRPPLPPKPSAGQPMPPPIPWNEASASLAETPVLDSPSSEIIPASESLPKTLFILPVHNRPIMPGITLPLSFQGDTYVPLLQQIADSTDKMIGVAYVRTLNKEDILKSELHQVGTVLKLVRVMVNEDGVQVLARALHRIECRQVLSTSPQVKWEVAYRRDLPLKPTEEVKAYTLAVISQVKELISLSPLFQEQLKMLVSHLDYENPGLIMDLITAMTTAEPHRIQDILATFDITERAKKVLQLLREEIDLQKLQQQIKSQIDDKISAHQKEFFLREQLKVIKKELGIEKDEKSADIEAFREKLSKLTLSAEASKVADEELQKLSLLEPNSSEYPLIRSYLTWLSDLPWGKFTPDNLDLKHAKTVLDATHFGLDDVKDRILEFLATIQKRGKIAGSILCLVGPPGVGKTSIGRSIADAMNRKFYRFSVGGMRDEAEIKGHRRTYVGAMPGKLIQSLKRTESANPVILIDEIDKLTTSYQGDPAAALLEVLDPEQNKDFLDHYLDVRFDLSNVLFLTTANSLDSIPAPLLDRMEIIKLSGYVMEEKLEIAKQHLLPHQLGEHGLKSRDLKIGDKVLSQLIEQYAREAGVRNLENQIRKICRKVARRQVEGDSTSVNLDSITLQKYLGLPVFAGEELYNKGVSGVALGLAWTAMGGATLYMEATALQSAQPGFKTTGRLGETMGESAQIAYSVARKILTTDNSDALDFFNKHLIHLHVPEGATPKDGPSAGITMALALYSLCVGKPVRPGIAMTGELTLTGKVLPIGGVREKVIAARRLKVMELILPKDNQRDFVALPDYIREGVTVHYADWFSDVLAVAFPGGTPKKVVESSQAPKMRGRPKVVKPDAPAEVASPKRPRGRPPRLEKPAKAIPTGTPKRRGRPPKQK